MGNMPKHPEVPIHNPGGTVAAALAPNHKRLAGEPTNLTIVEAEENPVEEGTDEVEAEQVEAEPAPEEVAGDQPGE